MEKNIQLFEICFAKAFKATQGLADFCMITYDDLYQDCWLVFDRAKECTNEKTYITYLTWKLEGAIKDYKSKILKTRMEWVDGKQKSINRLPHISLDFLFENRKEIKYLTTEHESFDLDAGLITEDVLSNGLLTDGEKMYFYSSFVEDFKDKEIARQTGASQQRISYIKKKVYTKLRARYGCANPP